ncbi:PREDICTED: obscurin-like, partial [Pterocles gutturalis]|uniref:obscurin-like n=1 Tax=Pterocles gutturalis TaxID=240206 RepID=UPI00052922BB
PPDFEEELADCTAELGETVKLACKVTGAPKPSISWFKDGKPVEVDPHHIIIEDPDGSCTLILDNLTGVDSGQYMCFASSPAGNVSTLGKILVQVPPRFVNKVRNAYFVEGEDAQFTCTIEGAPRPQIRWYKDGVLLKDTSKYQTFSEPRSGIIVLVVKNPSNEDMGHYECELVNRLGSAKSGAELYHHSAAALTQERRGDQAITIEGMILDQLLTEQETKVPKKTIIIPEPTPEPVYTSKIRQPVHRHEQEAMPKSAVPVLFVTEPEDRQGAAAGDVVTETKVEEKKPKWVEVEEIIEFKVKKSPKPARKRGSSPAKQDKDDSGVLTFTFPSSRPRHSPEDDPNTNNSNNKLVEQPKSLPNDSLSEADLQPLAYATEEEGPQASNEERSFPCGSEQLENNSFMEYGTEEKSFPQETTAHYGSDVASPLLACGGEPLLFSFETAAGDQHGLLFSPESPEVTEEADELNVSWPVEEGVPQVIEDVLPEEDNVIIVDEPEELQVDDLSTRDRKILTHNGKLLTLEDLEDYVPEEGETYGCEDQSHTAEKPCEISVLQTEINDPMIGKPVLLNLGRPVVSQPRQRFFSQFEEHVPGGMFMSTSRVTGVQSVGPSNISFHVSDTCVAMTPGVHGATAAASPGPSFTVKPSFCTEVQRSADNGQSSFKTEVSTRTLSYGTVGMTSPQSEMETSVQASLQRADKEIKTALKKLVDSASLLVTLPPGMRGGASGLGLPGSVPSEHSETASGPSMLVHEASTQTQTAGGHDKAQRQISAEEPNVLKSSPSPSREETAAGGESSQERTVPITRTPPAAGAEDWYRRERDVVWDIHSEVYIETTERTCVYKTDEKTPTSPPYMQVTIEDVQVNSGERAKFQAVIEGTPQPTVLWFKGTSLLTDSNRVHQGKEGTTYFLVVDDAVSEDGGVYTCVAKNAGGEVLCKAELIVHEGKKDQAAKKVATRRKLHSLYEVKQEIGRGCFSFVKRVVHKGNRVSCAAKFIPLRSKTKARAHQERDILASLSHDRITRLLDQFETRKTLILILELCSSEELLDRLFKKSVVTEAEVKLYIKQILEGIKYLHDNNVLHLDIKPLNILMVYPEREDLKLCDFGFAQKITPFEPQFSKYGSPEFVAPEIVSHSPVSKATDIWAVGVITYLSLTCKSPFAGENDRGTLLNIQNREISWTIPDFVHLSEDAKDFIKGILQQQPIARPSASDCLSHRWFMHNLPLEAAHFINTKQLKFIVARSKWQRSLMCYKSILVMRSIPEILERTHDNTSLAISRHLIEESTSSSTSGSSSDNENSHFPKKRHFGSTPELHLSIFDAPSHQEPPKHASEEKHSKISVLPVKPMRRKYASMKAEVGDKSPTESKELMESILKEKEEGLHPRLQDERAEQSQRSSGAEPSSVKASTESTSHLRQEEKPDIFISDKDKSDKAGDGTEKPAVCVPRQSVIKSTFYSQAAELPARGPSSPGREFRRHLDRARRTFRKAGYSKVPISGLREPLLEQFELEEEEEKSDDGDDRRESLLGSLTKSASFDTARKPPHPAIAGASRSRSLDDYRLRASRSVREQHILEEDCDIMPQESCPEGSDHCDISAGPGKRRSADASKQEDFRRTSKDCSAEQPSSSTQCEGNGCPAVSVQQLERLPMSPHRSENKKHLLKKSKATYMEEEAEDLEGKSPILTAQCSNLAAPSAPKHESIEAKSAPGSASDTAFQEDKQSIATPLQSETTSESGPTSEGGVCVPQESAHSTDSHLDVKGGSFLTKRTAPVPPWEEKRQKRSHEKPSAQSVAKSDLTEHGRSVVLTSPQRGTTSVPVSKDQSQEIPDQSVPATTALEGKRSGTLTAPQTADEGAHQKPQTYKEVSSAVLEDEGPGIAEMTPLSAHDGESQAYTRAPGHVDTAPAILEGERPIVPKVPPPKSMQTSASEGTWQARGKEKLAALRSEGSAATEVVPSLAHEAEVEGAKPQKVSEGSGMVPTVLGSRHPTRTGSTQDIGLPSFCEGEKPEHPKASLRREVRSVVTASGSPAAGQIMPAPFPKAGHRVSEQHRAAHPSGRVSAAPEGGSAGALAASQPEVTPASAYELLYEEYPEVYGEGRGVALESESCDAARTVPPSFRRDQSQDLSHHRSSFYSDEESAVLEGLVEDMVSLSEEMNIWAESVSGEEECRKHISPPTEMFYKGPGSQAPTDTSFPSGQGGKSRKVSELDDFAEPYLAVSEESAVLEGQGEQTVPHECEDLEDLAFETPPSSQVSVSSTDSLDTGKRPGQVSVSKDTGKHPEVSLVKIKDLSDETPSLGSGTPKLDISEVEPAYLNFSDLYDIVYFPFEFLNYRKPSPPKPTGRRFIPFGERARSPPAGHVHKEKKLCIREAAEDKNRKNRLEISEDSKATNLLAMGKGAESHKEMYGAQKDSSGKQKSSFYNKPGLFKPYARSHSVEQSVEQSLKKKVKASVAHISRILKGKTSPEPEEEFGELGSEAVEKELLTGAEGPLKRKSALSSFKLSSLMPKEKAPSFVEELIDQAAAVGQCVMLSCRTTAHSSLHINWFRDGIPVHSSSRILISATLKNFQLLTILSVNADDFGIYTCVATNSLGSASTSCIIRKA